MVAENLKPRVLIVAGQLTLGGAERELVTFLEGGASEGADIHVISLAPGGAFRPRVEELLGRDVLSPPWPDRPRRMLWMRRTLDRISPDLIHAWNLFPIFYLWLTGARHRCPVIGFLQQTPDQAMAEAAHPWLYRFLVEQTDALVSNSHAALEETLRIGVRKTPSRVVHNGVSSRFFQAEPAPEALESRGEGVVLVALGRLIKRKRVDWMLRAVAHVPEATLWVIGDGPEREHLEQLALDLGVKSRVVFWGARGDPTPILAGADVFVHCAWAEGLPNAVQEAMAIGLPVLAPRISGIPEVVSDGEEGLLYQRDDFVGFLVRLKRLIKDPDIRFQLGRNARLRAEREFAPEVMAFRILEFYKDVLLDDPGTTRTAEWQ